MTVKTSPSIDRVKLSNVTVTAIRDLNFLRTIGIVSVLDQPSHAINLPDGTSFDSLYINKKKVEKSNPSLAPLPIAKLAIGSSAYGQYGSIETFVANKLERNVNCYSVDEFNNYLKNVKDWLWNILGIKIDISEAIITQIEINKTIELNNPYEDYERPISLLSLSHSKLRIITKQETASRSNKKDWVTGKNMLLTETTRLTTGETGIDVTIYNKSAQLSKKHSIEVDSPILRYEIDLKTKEQVIRYLHITKLKDLTDEIVTTFYYSFISEKLISGYLKNKKDRQKVIKKVLKENYHSHSKSKYTDTIISITKAESNKRIILLDIREITEMLEEYFPKEDRRRRYEAKKALIGKCERNWPYLLTDGHIRLKEIVDKLSQ